MLPPFLMLISVLGHSSFLNAFSCTLEKAFSVNNKKAPIPVVTFSVTFSFTIKGDIKGDIKGLLGGVGGGTGSEPREP
jgi:hypothetical protein